MRITVQCDSCYEEFTVRPERAGHRVACKHCGAAVRVPDDQPQSSKMLTRSPSGRRSPPIKSADSNRGLLIGIGIGIGGGVAAVAAVVLMVVLGNRGTATNPAPAPAAAPQVTVAQASVASAIPSPSTPAPVAPEASPVVSTTASTPTVPAVVPLANTNVATTAATPSATATEPSAPSASPAKPVELDLPDLIAQVEQSVVRINVRVAGGASQGSGFVADTDGTVVTNYHVMEEAVSANVQFVDGTTAPVIGIRLTKPQHDICLIKIDLPKEKLHALSLAADLPRKGAAALAFGAPEGLSFSASQGIISAVRSTKEMAEELGIRVEGTWLQTDCSISHGSSGGPLTDRMGRVLGINTLGHAHGQNLNFAVSALDIAAALKEAPDTFKSFKLADLKPVQKGIDRTAARAEIGTPLGQKLFSEVKEVFLLNVTKSSSAALDPTRQIWERVIARSQVIVERTKLPLSFGEPADDAAVMLVAWDMKPTRKGTAGTQELHIKAFLVCFDPEAKKDASPVVKVWEEEDTIGTISLQSLATGQFPRTADEKLAQFFAKFQSGYTKAVRATASPAKSANEKKTP
jgi:S1-C subfamily serine protease